MTEKIMITGGLGYIGSYIVEILLNKGYKVRVLDNQTYGMESVGEFMSNPDFEYVRGDIMHLDKVAKALEGVDHVIALAGLVGDPSCDLDKKETILVNVESTKSLIELCKMHKIKKFVFASTCSVYGASDNYVLNEGSVLNPVSLYARTKIDCEKLLLANVGDNFSPTILRLSTVFGASRRMRFDLVLNIMTAKAVTEKKVSVFGGEQWRPMVHARDAARAFVLCLETEKDIKGQIFNVGANEQNFKITQIAEEVKNSIPGTVVTSGSVEDARSYNVSFDKISKYLGYKTEKSLKDGILEIQKLFVDGTIKNYKDKKYSNVNYKFLK